MNSTEHYQYTYVEANDILYPGYDQRNMQITENQLAQLAYFIGSGVLTGWVVTPIVSTDPQQEVIYQGERLSLYSSYLTKSNINLAQQYLNMGKPADTYAPCLVCVTANISNFSSVNISYFDGLGSSDLVANSRVLVTNQTIIAHNGIYTTTVNLDGTYTLTPSTVSNEVVGQTILNPSKIQILKGVNYGNTIFTFMKPTGYTYTFGGSLPSGLSNVLYSMNWILDSQATNVSWNQVIRVTPGTGILGSYRAYTEDTAYFAYTQGGTYYVWLQAGPCLITQGIAQVVAPLDQDYNYDQTNLATFLATVDVLPNTEAGYGFYIDPIRITPDKRVTIAGFATALQNALKILLRGHVHTGVGQMPTKINLSTVIVYFAYPSTTYPDATSFQIGTGSGSSFVPATNLPTTLGKPVVTLNDVVLLADQYYLNYSTGIIYLQNSIPANSVIELEFPAAPQINLTPTNTTAYGLDVPIYLTDGTTDLGGSGNQGTFRWNPDNYMTPQVYFNGNLIVLNVTQPQYLVDPTNGCITVYSSSGLTLPTTESQLVVVLVERVYQITNTLSSKRIGSIDASTFITGTIDPTRLGQISHVGETRLNEIALLQPTQRVFAEDDHVTFLPEIPNSPFQYGTEVYFTYKSINLPSNSTLLGTKRGLMATDDMINIINQSSWNVDYGQPVQAIDNLMPETPLDPNAVQPNNNVFKTLYVRTEQGQIFETTNEGASWKTLRMPQFTNFEGITSPLSATAFWCYTDMELTSGDLQTTTYSYFTRLYVGTAQGLFTTVIYPAAPTDWAWTPSSNQGESINDVVVIATLNSTITYSGSSLAITNQSYDATVYTATDNGIFVNGAQFNYPGMDLSINGVKWVNFGTENVNKNSLLYYSDQKLCLTHSAVCTDYTVSGDNDTVTAYYSWVHPLTQVPNIFEYPNGQPGVKAATTTNISITPSSSNFILPIQIDTVSMTWAVNDLILVKQQNNSYENGIYKVITVNNDIIDGINTGTLVCSQLAVTNNVQVQVIQNSPATEVTNSQQYGSQWFLPNGPDPTNPNTTSWNLYFYLYDRTDNPNYGQEDFQYTNASLIQLTQQYFLGCLPAPLIITDQNIGIMPIFTPIIYWNNRQYLPQSAFYLDISINNVSTNVFIALGTRGAWYTEDFVGWGSWMRLNPQFTVLDTVRVPTLWVGEKYYLSQAMPVSVFEAVPTAYPSTSNIPLVLYYNEDLQIFEFSNQQPIYDNYLYLDSYTEYFVKPWNPLATVIVKVNNVLAAPTYVPQNGQIIFSNSLGPNDIVTFTAILAGAFISNVGTIPHEEQPSVFVVQNGPTSPNITLAAQFPSANASLANQIQVTTPSLIPSGYSLIEVSQSIGSTVNEVLYIYKDPITSNIELAKPRVQQTVMPTYAAGSPVYLVVLQSVPGLQDYVSQFMSGQMYNQNSSFLNNIISLNLSCLELTKSDSTLMFPNLLHNYATMPLEGTLDTRGPQNAAYYTNENQFEDVSSANSLAIEYNPPISQLPTAPQAVYNLDLSSSTSIVGTDQGIWQFSSGDNMWTQISQLNSSRRTYFIYPVDNPSGAQLVGTELGLFEVEGNNWVANPTFYEAVFDYWSGSWNTSYTGTFYAKNDGLSFTQFDPSTNTFVSDNFDPLYGEKLYTLYKDQWLRAGTDTPPTFTAVDAMYIGSALGLWAVTPGGRVGINHPTYLAGRNMIPASELTRVGINNPLWVYKIALMPNNSTANPPSAPMMVLSNQGILIIQNWRYCDPDPTDTSALNFYIEKVVLPGYTCNCVTSLVTSTSPYASVVYAGTNVGVFKSINNGWDFQRCEWINDEPTPVYDLQIMDSAGLVVIAATETGLWMTTDGGYTWIRPSLSSGLSPNNFFPGEITSSYSFSYPKLGQTFTTPSTPSTIDITKFGAYLTRRTLVNPNTGVVDDAMNQAAANNKLMLALYATDGSGNPTGSALSLTSFESYINWGVGYEVTPSGTNLFDGSQVMDNEPNDISTYYQVVGGSTNNSAMTLLYKFDNAVEVDAVDFTVMSTQVLNVNIEHSSDGSTWTTAIATSPTVYAPQNAGGVPLWRTAELLTNTSTPYQYWRISFTDIHSSYPTLLRVGDCRLYAINGGTYTLQTLYSAINAYEVNYPSFWYMDAVPSSSGSLTLTANTQYILVGSELLSEQIISVMNGYSVSSGNYLEYGSVFEWAISSDDEFVGGDAEYSSDGSTWTALPQDFLFAVFYASPPVPTNTIVVVGQYDGTSEFDQGDMYGAIINDAGGLTTDFKVATSIVVDDSKSISWADDLKQRGPMIYDLYSKIYSQCNGRSQLDYWQFGVNELELTPGFVYDNSIVDLENTINNFITRGTNSNLVDTCFIAFMGLSPQSIIDSILPVPNLPNQVYNQALVEPIITYMESKGLLRLSWLQTQYATELGAHTLVASDLYTPNGSDQLPYLDITTAVITAWANSFVPLAIVLADGDDSNSLNAPTDVASVALTGWNNYGFSIYSGGLGTGSNQPNLRSMSELSNGNHSILVTGMDENGLLIPGSDWDNFGNSFLPQGTNNIFQSTWAREYDFETPTFISNIIATVNVIPNGQAFGPNSAKCNIEFMYTLDRTNWTSWINIASQLNDNSGTYTYQLNMQVLAIKYNIVMSEALAGGQQPVISELYHIVVTPAVKYLVTPKTQVNGLLFEYLLDADITVPQSCQVNWGIARGDSINWNDFESIYTRRKGALSNRQNSITFSQPVNLRDLPHTINAANDYVQVYTDQAETITASWSLLDTVQIWIQITTSLNGNYETDGSAILMQQNVGGVQVYQLDGVNGTIAFSPPLPTGTIFHIDINAPSQVSNSVGESTITKDNRTYFSVNGSWVYDSTVYVILQTSFGGTPQLIRGGYWLNPSEGSVTFSQERLVTDIIKLFIVSDGYFRIGAQVLNYTSQDVSINDFGMYYSVAQNESIGALLSTNSSISLMNNQVVLSPQPASVGQNILDINYVVVTNDGSTEQGSIITWWVGRPGFTGSSTTPYSEFDAANQLWFKRIHVNNIASFTGTTYNSGTFPVYDGRILSLPADQTSGLFQNGDIVYVKVVPSNGIVYGTLTKSNIIKFLGYSIPVITNLAINNVVIKTVNNTTQYQILKTQDLVPTITMSPSYSPPNVTYSINWYLTTNNTPVNTNGNAILPSSQTVLGSTYYCVAQPFNNGVPGPMVFSEPITIVTLTS